MPTNRYLILTATALFAHAILPLRAAAKVDFNLQIPSNGMLTVLLGGVLAATVLPGGGQVQGARRAA